MATNTFSTIPTAEVPVRYLREYVGFNPGSQCLTIQTSRGTFYMAFMPGVEIAVWAGGVTDVTPLPSDVTEVDDPSLWAILDALVPGDA